VNDISYTCDHVLKSWYQYWYRPYDFWYQYRLLALLSTDIIESISYKVLNLVRYRRYILELAEFEPVTLYLIIFYCKYSSIKSLLIW